MKETYKDIGFTVVYEYEYGNAHVVFSVYEIMAEADEGIYYEGIGGCGADDKMTQDLRQANKYIHGSVKWDGCSHFYFGDPENSGYIHLCGDYSVKNHLEIVRKVYLRCGKIMLEGGNPPDPDEFRI